jgi:hypothetical protein
MAAAVAITATGASNTIRERKRVICSSSPACLAEAPEREGGPKRLSAKAGRRPLL